jgi:2-C-methyl-D-erythritol 4-phosphate cytidylyltransferase
VTVAAVVPVVGRGERLGPALPKALQEIGGVPMLAHCAGTVAAARLVDLVVVAAPASCGAVVRRLLADHEMTADVNLLPGRCSRQESVRLAVAALPADVDVVLVHDATRPLVPVELVDAVAAAVLAGADAVVPALPVVETIKEVDGSSVVRRTVDRSRLRAVQAPQGFRRAVLERAHAAAVGGGAIEGGAVEGGAIDVETDDAALVARLGVPVRVIPGAAEAFRVARAADVVVAEALVSSRRVRTPG